MIRKNCKVVPKLVNKASFCALCGKKLEGRRTRWCSDKCSNVYYNTLYNNHDWSSARKAAKRRDRWKCVTCGSKVKLEVDHIVPLNGRKRTGLSCLHHLSNLRTLCKVHHLESTKEQRAAGLIRTKRRKK